MYKKGDKIRFKTDIDFAAIGLDGDNNRDAYLREKVTELAGKQRTISYVSRDAAGKDMLNFRGVYWPIPAACVEPLRKKIKTINVDKLTDNSIIGQDKIKKQLKHAVEQDMSVLLIGETGTGKTTLVKDLATTYGSEWLRFNLTGETTVDEFVGKYTLENGQTKWQDGVLLSAMRQGLWLVVDEINVALPEILFVLHSLLDDDKSVMVAQHDGEIVKPHQDFKFFATMNPVEEYAGTKELNKAFMSRFGMILKLEYPKPEYEKAILIHKAGVEADIADKLVDVAVTLRKAKAEGEIFYTCSTRDLLQLAKLVKPLGLSEAMEVSIVNKANGDGDKVRQLIGRIVDMYREAEKALGSLNIESLTAKISEMNQQIINKDDYLTRVNQIIDRRQEELDKRDQQLSNRADYYKSQVRRELLAELGNLSV